MLKKILIVLLISAFLPFTISAQWMSLDKTQKSNTTPKVTILSDDVNSTVIKIDISGFDINTFISDGKTYQSIDLLSEIFTTKPGFPEIDNILLKSINYNLGAKIGNI